MNCVAACSGSNLFISVIVFLQKMIYIIFLVRTRKFLLKIDLNKYVIYKKFQNLIFIKMQTWCMIMNSSFMADNLTSYRRRFYFFNCFDDKHRDRQKAEFS